MTDREKAIKGLECHQIDNNHRINCADCPYYVDDDNHIRCVNDLHDDAIALLNEQEAKTGHWISVNDGDVVAIDNDGFPERACFCSECKKYLIASDEYAVYGRYCPFCGAKMEGSVKFDD